MLKIRKGLAAAVQGLKSVRLLEEMAINQGRLLAAQNEGRACSTLDGYSFKVFSQWGEDGIIQHLVNSLPIRNRTFIEFGVEDFSEANCRFLMMKDNWSGMVIDGSQSNIDSIMSRYWFWRFDLRAECAFIDRDNIGDLLARSGFDRDLGILSVDIDGVDYFVLEKVTDWRPAIIIVEYNPVFGYDRALTVPYDPSFYRTRAHSSNLYYGANLPAFDHLLAPRGYSLVGVNQQRSNAFFVRNELLNDRVAQVQVADVAQDSTFRESRDDSGRLTYASMAQRRSTIGHLPVLDIATGRQVPLSDVL